VNRTDRGLAVATTDAWSNASVRVSTLVALPHAAAPTSSRTTASSARMP
jgi:hypothetical protein